MIPNKLTDTEYKVMPITSFAWDRKCVKLIEIQRSCLY
jgi:hypothetical protein